MKPLRIVVILLFVLCILIVPQAANAQYGSGGTAYSSTQILYDEPTGYVLAEGRAVFYTSFAEVFTGGRWQVTLDFEGPNGYIGSTDFGMYLNGYSTAYLDTYVDESGYGDYNASTTVTMLEGSLDYLGFYYFGFSGEGFQEVTVDGGPYYAGMPCYDEWLGFYLNGPCYPYPPAPYTTEPAQVARSTYSRTIDGPSLSCTSSVTRGGTATCDISPRSGVTAKDWIFRDGNTPPPVIRSTDKESLTWSGTMVTSGTVQVTATIRGTDTPLTASVVVNDRNWHIDPASTADKRNNGYFYTLPVPPQPTGLDAGLGHYRFIANYSGSATETILDNGPNHGYTYFTQSIAFTAGNKVFEYVISPDLENSSSDFSIHQCEFDGYISWQHLYNGTRRHEFNSDSDSHYANYKQAWSANNGGDYVEQQVAAPGQNVRGWLDSVTSTLNSYYDISSGTIATSTAIEPSPVNEVNGQDLYINYKNLQTGTYPHLCR